MFGKLAFGTNPFADDGSSADGSATITITTGAYALTGTAAGLLWKHKDAITPGAYSLTGGNLNIAPPRANGVAISNNTNTTVTDLGGSVYKIVKTGGGSPAYDAGAVSGAAATGDFVLRLGGVQNLGLLGYGAGGGVNADPLADDSYASIDNLWLFDPLNSTWSLWEGGGNIASGLANATYAWIWRTGTSLGYGRGSTLAIAQAAPDRTTTSTGAVYFDSTIAETGAEFNALFYTVPAQTAAAVGSYTLTGTATGLLWKHRTPINVGSYALTGTTTGLAKGSKVTVTPGAYTLSGQTVTAKWGHRTPINVGSYSLTGTAVSLLKGRTIAIVPGSYSISGQTVGLLWKHKTPLNVGSYAITGTATSLKWGHRVSAVPGAYALTGTATGLLWKHRVSANVGSYSLTGVPVSLLNFRGISIDVGAYTLNGVAVTLMPARKLAAVPGSYVFNGTAVNLIYTPIVTNYTITIAPGAYVLTGNDVSLIHVVIVPPKKFVVRLGEHGSASSSGRAYAAREIRAHSRGGSRNSRTGSDRSYSSSRGR